MKILLINNYHYLRGGSERAYFDTAKVLEQNGHQVAFFSTKNPKNKPTQWDKYFISDIDLASNLSFVSKAKAFIRLFTNPEADSKLRALIAEFKPDIVHLHNIAHHLSPSIIRVIKSFGLPLVMTLHDYQLISPSRNLLVRGRIWEESRPNKFYRCFKDRCIGNSYSKSFVAMLEGYWHYFFKSYSGVDCFVSPSVFLLKKFHEYGFSGKIFYLPNPIFAEEISHILSWENNHILFYGRLDSEKGVDDLLSAYSQIETDVNLHIVGDGSMSDYLRNKAKRFGGRVKFFGRLEGESLWRMVRGARFVVIPSRWYENAPYSALEPMALGRVVLAADIGGLGEIIRDKKNGFLFKAGDVDDLEKKMRHLLSGEEDMKKIGQRAAADVKENNSPAKYYDYLMEVYMRARNK
jgi:glycosyltransferase involved in cell wall biosynthesis